MTYLQKLFDLQNLPLSEKLHKKRNKLNFKQTLS